MRRLARSVGIRLNGLPRCAFCEAARWKTSASPSQPTEDGNEVTSVFPGEEVTATEAPPSHRSKSDMSRHRRHSQQRSEADGLVSDIFRLQKQVAVEQQRQRLSVRASRLGEATTSRAAATLPRSVPSPALAAEMMAAEGVYVPETPAAAVPPPVLTVPSAEETAAAARRARRLEGGVAAFVVSSSSPAAAPPSTSTLPPLQSWTPPFALTSERLHSSLDGPASDVAFTLEELENTLFTPSAEATEQGKGEANSLAFSVTRDSTDTTTAVSPPPPPPSSPPATPSSATSSTTERVSSDSAAAATGEEELKQQEVKETPVSKEEAARLPENVKVPPNSNATSGNRLRSTAAPQVQPLSPASKPLPPVLKCRLRGTAVVVTMSRVPCDLCELVEALQEAVTFAESLPTLPQESREVRLRVDPSAPECAAFSFLGVRDLSAVASSLTERVGVQFMKERLLRRMQDGHHRKLHYVAEVHVQPTAVPSMLENFTAELLLACDAHEMRSKNGLDGGAKDAVKLSFRGIGVGVFPAPATARRMRKRIAVMLAREDQRGPLLTHLGRKDYEISKEQSAFDLASVTANTMLCLHLLPTDVTTALLMTKSAEDVVQQIGSLSAQIGRARSGVGAFIASLLQRWAAVKVQRGGVKAIWRSPEVRTESSLTTCVTAAQVWSWVCEAVLRPGATDTVIRDAVTEAMRAAPLQRCLRSYAFAAAPILALQSLPLIISKSEAAAGRSTAASSPYVIEVSLATLAQTSVTDLASEIRDQPSDVVLAIAASVPLERRLKFLASLHLIDTGDHHQVMVLLSGKPQEIDECASLTRSSARLVAAPGATDCGPTIVSPAEPSWLHQTVEVSLARSPPPAVPRDGWTAPEVNEAVQYVVKNLHRPCVVTTKSDIGLALRRAAHNAEMKSAPKSHDIASVRGTAAVIGRQLWQQSLTPLVPLCHDALGVVARVTEPPRFFSPPRNRKTVAAVARATVDPGLAFLMVLDAACQALCREEETASPAAVNVLSIAALQLDASAGGVFDAADRVSADSVEGILTAMEAAAAEHSVSFASLSLLRWMVEEKLLFYQLNSTVITRFSKAQPQG
ncbi:hypothetical protein ABB37_04061 [Leptomonas pyrrhocoris]|uniref:Uncharacterized protein n=1 Tax=Leptomonas pyrrhocoris TaxID=157538 RepID=A0A0N0VFY2_LEPPY|nr:hypothetical protein ABB37_04061 [Leptomonas pyrrhocoris]KPA81782.1 hypothetical protein ABB37_04061 [Leptomonas pyrrhocoris]|eukprot:XP_015660221.1 hypothetical protein ABB37_04061 [Leptomonas pyrrhocoris]